MNDRLQYDVIIAGGGLAGLSCAILLAKNRYSVLVIEKDQYPAHKVCGEYISLESYDLLESLGLPLKEQQLPIIRRLLVSSPSGNHLVHGLPLGGFGISRYKIDHELMQIARADGVHIIEKSRVNEIINENGMFQVQTDSQSFSSRVVCAAFGKRSNLDIKWKRRFTMRKPNALNNYIGVKYHAYIDRPDDLIELHNFKDGYCGISPLEEGKSCICYLTTAENLKHSANNIEVMEKKLLSANPLLEKVFDKAKMLFDKPLTISQVSFDKKKQFENGVVFIGDAASMIAPLCGNGMSMALHGSRIAASCIKRFLCGEISLDQMGAEYTLQWNATFQKRLAAGRMIQSLFGSEWLTNAAISVLKKTPRLLTTLIRQTHG